MKTQIELYSNIFRHLSLMAIAACGCAVAPTLLAQSDLPPTPPGMAEYYSALARSGNGSPGGVHAEEDSGPPGPGGGLSGDGGCNCSLPDYTTGLWLSIALGSEGTAAVVTLHNATNGLFCILEAATNLAGPWFTSQTFFATNVGSNTNMVAQPIAIEDFEGLFFRALQVTPGQLRWKVQLTDPATATQDAFGGGLDAAPSLSPDGQTLYMTTPNRTISAIDAGTGRVLWTDSIFTTNASTPQPAEFTGAAAVTSSNLYVGSCDGNLYCLNATNGSTNWIQNMGPFTAVYATPSIDPTGRILVPTDETQVNRDGNPITGLTCLVPGPTNASVAWFFQPQDVHDNANNGLLNNAGDIDSSVAVANNGTIYFLAEGWRLYSIDPAGTVNWFIPVQAGNEPDSSVAIDSFGRILVGCNSEYVYCVNPDGSLEWTLPMGPLSSLSDFGPMLGSPTIGPSNALYTGTGGLSGNLISLDPSGDPNWVITTGSAAPTLSSPAVGETTLYFGSAPGVTSTTGEFFALTLSNHTVAWSFTNTNEIVSSPLICPDASVVYGCEDGWLYCFWGSSLPAGTNAPWPTFHQNNQRTGLQPGTNTLAENCGAPFLFDGTNDQEGTFTFDIVGPTNGTWTVYSSTNLSNWVLFATDVTLSSPSGNPTAPGTNTIIDDTVSGVTNRYYQLSNSVCCSRAIGFTRLILTPGTNLVADQLCQVDEGVMDVDATQNIPTLGFTMNDLNALFDLNPWATSMGSTAVFSWNGNGFDGDTNGSGNGGLPAWEGGGNMTMLAGTSVFMFNPNSDPYVIWFTGLVRNQQVFSLQPGTNYLSATVPIAGPITNITGYISHAGDIIRLWNTSSNAFVSHTNTSGSWSNGGLPDLSVGEGFVLVSTNAYTWTNNWLTGVCGDP